MTNYTPALDQVFHALADPTRRVMVERLTRGPASVGELAKPFGMALPTVLQHLKVLEASGLVRSEKQGRVRTCALQAPAMDAAGEWIARQRAVWEARLDRLDAYLRDLQAREGEDDGTPR